MKTQKHTLLEAQRIAEGFVGQVRWTGAQGQCECPGIDLHTAVNAASDCKVVCEPVPLASGTLAPGIYCHHESCREAVDAINTKLRSALGKRSFATKGLAVRRASQPRPWKAKFDPVALARIAAQAPWVDEKWLAARSRIPVDQQTPGAFLRELYLPGEKVVIFSIQKSQGQAIWTHQGPPNNELIRFTKGKRKGVWFLAQPTNGQQTKNDRGNLSVRSWQNVTAWRFVVVESDQADPVLWLSALAQLPLRIVAIYTSGGRSIHALVRIDAKSKEEWDERVAKMEPILVTLGADPGALTAVRLTRLPCCERVETGAVQRLLYLNPGADGTPIVKMEVRP